jgi:hypothetical protein
MKSSSRAFIAALWLIAILPACSAAQRTSLLPAAVIAQPACHSALQATFNESRVVPADSVIVWKSCTYKGDNCDCAYNMSNHPPTLDVYACEAGYGDESGIATAGPLMYAGHGKTVVIFKGKRQVGSLKGLTGEPIGLVVDVFGNVWATNSPSATISEFAKGATEPTATYTDSNLTSASYLAVDAAGDVYVEGQADYDIEVDVLPVKSTSFTRIAQPGSVGLTPGGLAVQNAGKKLFVWINDQGTASNPAAISKYSLKGGALFSKGSFQYSGVNGAIWADPAGRNLSRVFAVNNVVDGSEYATSAVEYAMPSGKIVNATAASTSADEAVGIAGAFK